MVWGSRVVKGDQQLGKPNVKEGIGSSLTKQSRKSEVKERSSGLGTLGLLY